MKKIITILVLLSFAGTTVFANSQPTVKDKAITSVQTDMFSDVKGSTLTDSEMDETDGEGLGGVFLGGAIDGGLEAYSQHKKYGKIKYPKDVALHAAVGAAAGAFTGGVGSVRKAYKVGRGIHAMSATKKVYNVRKASKVVVAAVATNRLHTHISNSYRYKMPKKSYRLARR